MIRPWFRQAAVPWKTMATQTRHLGRIESPPNPGCSKSANAMISLDCSVMVMSALEYTMFEVAWSWAKKVSTARVRWERRGTGCSAAGQAGASTGRPSACAESRSRLS
jgi:hypothetical protein